VLEVDNAYVRATGEDVVTARLDSRVDLDYPMLGPGWGFIENDDQAQDEHGHVRCVSGDAYTGRYTWHEFRWVPGHLPGIRWHKQERHAKTEAGWCTSDSTLHVSDAPQAETGSRIQRHALGGAGIVVKGECGT